MASDYENVRLDSDAASTPHDEGSFFSSGHVHVHVHAREQLQRHLQLVAQRQVQARQKQKQKKKLPGNHLVVFAAAAAAIISLFTLQKLRGTPKPDQPALIVPLLINTTALACSALIPLALPLYHLCPALIGPPHDHGPQTLQASQILPERLLATLERDFEWIAFTAGDMQDQESDSCLVPVVNLTHSIVDDHYAAHAATECATRLHEANRVFKELRGDLVHPSVSFVDLAVGLRDMWNWVLLLGMVDEEQGDESFERASLMENWAEDMVRMRDDIERNAKMVAEVRQSLGGIQGLQTGVVVPYLMVLAGKDTWYVSLASWMRKTLMVMAQVERRPGILPRQTGPPAPALDLLPVPSPDLSHTAHLGPRHAFNSLIVLDNAARRLLRASVG